MSESIRSLPEHPSLEQQKKLAKELLKAFQSGDDGVRDRVRAQLPDKERITLADAQFVLAREYGFDSWTDLKSGIAAREAASNEAQLREQFKQAVSRRDVAALRALFEKQPAARTMINEPIFSFGSPALVNVTGHGDLALINVLLEFGADPNHRSDWAMGPWHALYSADETIANRLIEAGADVDACAAAHLGRVDLLRRILDEDPARINERGGDGQMPLHFAGRPDVVDLLLERGADPDARDHDHRGTAAQWMLDHKRGAGRYDLAKYLVERGASADIFLACALGLTDRLRSMLEADPSLLDLKTHQGDYDEKPPSSYHIYTWTIGQNLSPLQVAAQFEQNEALALLRPFASEKQRFMAACAMADEAEAKQLIRANPSLVEQLTMDEKRALPEAGWAANAPAVELMLDLGFDPRVTGAIGGTVLHCAAWEGSAECVTIALRHPTARALINEIDPVHTSTPLGWCIDGAVHCGNPTADHLAVAQLLLEAGASLNPKLVAYSPPSLAQLFKDWQGGS